MAFTRRADIAAKAQKHHDAIRFFKESISVLTEEADLRHAAIANVGLAGSLRKLGRLSDAEAALDLAMGIQSRVLESTPIAEGELGADGRAAYVSALLDSSLGFAEKAEQCFTKDDYVCACSSAGTACQLQRKAQTDCDQRIIDLQALAYHARTRSPKEPLAARKGSSSASAK